MFGYTGGYSANDIVKSMNEYVHSCTTPASYACTNAPLCSALGVLNKKESSAVQTPQKQMTPGEAWAYGLMAGLEQAFGVKYVMLEHANIELLCALLIFCLLCFRANLDSETGNKHSISLVPGSTKGMASC
jgi:hypothetical protein